MSEVRLNAVQRKTIEWFIREDLGCTCPDEVFRTITVAGGPDVFEGLADGYLITIGEKLLVFVVRSNDWQSVQGQLGWIFNRGRQLRDSGGFKRFRLVVATEDVQRAQPELLHQFGNLKGLDDRLHLHVVPHSALAELVE